MYKWPFYHGHLRKLIAGFGSLFDDIRVSTVDGGGVIRNIHAVPIRYAGAEPTLVNTDPSKKPYNEIYPRMSFEIVGISPDKDRSVNPNNVINGVRAPSNYTVDFGLYILARNMSDAFQVMEQILPFFNPTLTITMVNAPNNGVVDTPITLTAVSIQDDYEGAEDKERRIEIGLNFTCYLDFYGPSGSAYEIALAQFIDPAYKRPADDPTLCSPPRWPINTPGQKNRIEKIFVDFYTNKVDYCASAFDGDPSNLPPDSQVVVEATAQEIFNYDKYGTLPTD